MSNYVYKVNTRNDLVGRRDIIQLLRESLSKTRMKNSILVGDSGSGKTAIIEQFAHEMSHFYDFYELDIGGCIAGTRYRGDFEEKLTHLIDKVIERKKTKPIILFIDEIHTITTAGGAEGAVTAGDILKPYLSRGDITIIGATTYEEYKKTIYLDKALRRRLCPIFIDNLNNDDNLKILQNFCNNQVENELLQYILDKISDVKGISITDTSIEILDRCMARKKVTGKTITKKMINNIISYLLRKE